MIRRAAPFFWRDVGDLPAELSAQQAAEGRIEGDLALGVRERVLAHHLSDRPFGVEEGTERAARQDAVAESEAAGPEQVELGGGAPGHLLRLEGRDELVALVDVG